MSDGPGRHDRQGSTPPPGYRPPRPPAEAGPAQPAPQPEPTSPASPQAAAPGADPLAGAAPGPEEYARQQQAAAADSQKPGRQKSPVPSFLKAVRPHHVLGLVLSHLTFYLTLLLLSVVTVIGLIAGVALEAEAAGAPGEFTQVADELELGGALAALTLPFQLVGVWLFGQLRFTVDVPADYQQFLGSSTMEFLRVFAPNLLVVLLATVLAVWAGRMWARRFPGAGLSDLPWSARLLLGTAVSLLSALLTLLVTFALAFRTSFTEGGETVRMVAGAAGAALFFGALALFLLITVLLCASPALLSRARGAADSVLPSASRMPRVLTVHAVVIGVPVLAYATIMMALEVGAVGPLSFLFWASTVAVSGFVLLNAGALTAAMGTTGFGGGLAESETLYLWTTGLRWWEVTLAVILGLVALGLASLTWAVVRRPAATGVQKVLSWLTLPVLYGVTGAVLTVFGQLRIDFDAGGFTGGGGTFGPAWWTFLILLLVGVVIELLARFAFGPAAKRLPRPLRRLLGGRAAAAV